MDKDRHRLAQLVGLQRDLLSKLQDVNDEIDRLLNGGPSIAEQVKAVEVGFDVAWCERYAPGQAKRYVWNYQKDRAQIKRVLKTLSADEITRRAMAYIRNSDPFFEKARHSFALFIHSINTHTPPADFELAEPVFNCDHRPSCRSDAEHTSRSLADSRGL